MANARGIVWIFCSIYNTKIQLWVSQYWKHGIVVYRDHIIRVLYMLPWLCLCSSKVAIRQFFIILISFKICPFRSQKLEKILNSCHQLPSSCKYLALLLVINFSNFDLAKFQHLKVGPRWDPIIRQSAGGAGDIIISRPLLWFPVLSLKLPW